MAVESNSFLSEFFRAISYSVIPRTILLDQFHYLYLQDRNSGKITLREGPDKVRLKGSEQMVGGLREKIRVADGQFAIVLNPFDAQKQEIMEGERQIRVGPMLFSLYPGEALELTETGEQTWREYVLNDSEGLLLYALKDTLHPLNVDETMLAGEEVLLKGPRRYILDKNVRVVEQRRSFSIGENQGIYVQNIETGKVRLVIGPTDYFQEHNERLWERHLSIEESQALGYTSQAEQHKELRILSSAPIPRKSLSEAVVISLEGNEAIYLYDGERVRVVFGPQTIFFEPNERAKVLYISGGLPLRPNMLRVAKLSLGPDFIRDQIVVRTKDNATLTLDVTYRWRFRVDSNQPENLFSLKDFVGFAAQTLAAEIRGEAARHDFEKFHVEAGILVSGAVFGNTQERIFEENGLVIFGIDVEKITPKEDQISERLSEAILTNVEIYTQTAREKAQLARERELIEGRAINEETSKQLIELEITNHRRKVLEEAQTIHETAIVNAQAEADAIRIRAAAELESELERLRAITEILETKGGQAYIRLEQARVLRATDKVIVPTDSKIYLGTTDLLSDNGE